MSRGRPSTKRRNTKTFVVPDSKLYVYDKFKELCIREGESMSGKIVTWIDQYVQAHYPGNPQLPLTKFTKPIPAPGDPRVKENLSLVLAHLEKGCDLNPKAHRYYTRLAQQNKELPEAQKLLKLLGSIEK